MTTLEFIDSYWDKCTYKPGQQWWGGWRNLIMRLARIKLPNAIVSPNHKYFAGTQFYWDTYFTVVGLVVGGRGELAKGMVDNLCYLFGKFGYIPARNSWTSLQRSQPPYLTRMAFEVYEHGAADKQWLGRVMTVAQKEYDQVWTKGARLHEPTRLSRYSPGFLKRSLSVYESGWDRSSRYLHPDVIPVDLNCQLYQYEKDFARYARLTKNPKAAKTWEAKAANRQKLIEEYFWDEATGFYYDVAANKLVTLAGFYPLWAGVASPARAKRALKKLKELESAGGLTNCSKLPWTGRQWDYPNGWPPQQYITYQALMNYGFKKDAQRLAQKYLQLCDEVYAGTGWLWEKYDVVKRRPGRAARYTTQRGFAWTAGVYLRLKQELS